MSTIIQARYTSTAVYVSNYVRVLTSTAEASVHEYEVATVRQTQCLREGAATTKATTDGSNCVTEVVGYAEGSAVPTVTERIVQGEGDARIEAARTVIGVCSSVVVASGVVGTTFNDRLTNTVARSVHGVVDGEGRAVITRFTYFRVVNNSTGTVGLT